MHLLMPCTVHSEQQRRGCCSFICSLEGELQSRTSDKGAVCARWQALTAGVDDGARVALHGMMQHAQELRSRPPQQEEP